MKETFRALALAAALPNPSPWATWEQQRAALSAALSHVSAMKALGYRPVIDMDLDLTSMLAPERPTTILRDLAPQALNLPSLPDLSEDARQVLADGLQKIWENPSAAQTCLPGYTDGAITGYGIYLAAVLPARLGVALTAAQEDALSEWIRSTVYPKLRNGYWSRDVSRDEISPGFVDFVAEVYRSGGEVVFISNRSPSDREKSVARLTSAVAAAGLLLSNDPAAIPLFAYFGPGGSAFDQAAKEAAQTHLEQNPAAGVRYAQVTAGAPISFGNDADGGAQVVTVAYFDDRLENRRQLLAVATKSAEALQHAKRGGICSVAIATLWHTAEDSVTDAAYVVASFEWNRPTSQ